MKRIFFATLLLTVVLSCKEASKKETATTKSEKTNTIIQVAEFKGQQVTGVTVTDNGRLFVNFPRWRKGVENSVIEVTADGKNKSYPNASYNSWKIGDSVSVSKFIGVQSVVAFENNLYVLDTRSQLFEKVFDAPRIFVFDLKDDSLSKTYILDKGSYHADSYINDLRVDKKNNKIYLTDSGHAGLVVLDMKTGTSKRVLNDHKSTSAEVSSLNFDGKKWVNTVHSDGIALDTKNDKLYYHALTGYSLYAIPTTSLLSDDKNTIEEHVVFEAKTAAPDGMIFDKNGNLYFADLENNKIQYRKPDGSIHTLVEGDEIKWADTFSIYNDYLYFTNSRINEITGNISGMTFTVNKIRIADNK